MERSQSCCNFEEKHTNNNTNPTPSLGNGPAYTPTSANGRREHRRTKTKSSSAHNLRQLIDGRPHSSLMQQVHELKQQQQQQAEIHLLPRALHHHHHSLLPYSHKKSPLQRQKSTRSYAADEPDYSADLEDDEDYDYDDGDDDDGDVIMAAPHAAKQLILPAAAGDLGATNHPATPQQVHRATLIIDTKLKHCSLQEIAVPRPRTPTTAASTPISTPTTTSPSPLHSTKTFRLPGHHHHHKQLSLDLPPCSPSPSLSMFVQQHCRHHSAGTPDSGTCGSPLSLRRHNFSQLKRGNSLQSHSDSSSHYSSVDSLLESRKPDPEAILINLGFGPAGTEDILSRIPKRFLKPSQVRGIDTEAFVKRLQLANSLADHSALGYRGLTGNPDLPPSSIVAKIMQRFEVNERKKSMGSIETHMR